MNGTHIINTKTPSIAFDITTLKFRLCVVEGNAGRHFDFSNDLTRQPQHHIPVERR